MLSNNQITQLKKQIISQIDENFPADKKDFTTQQVQAMTNQEFEEFLKQNHLIKNLQNPQEQCIFCSIIHGQIQSYKIDENQDAVAILEINPISKAHTLIIPKEHISSEQMSNSVLELAKKVSQKIKKQFAPKEVNLFLSTLFNHSIINILPIYTDENQNSKRKQANPKELLEIQSILANNSLGVGETSGKNGWAPDSEKEKIGEHQTEIIKKPKLKKLKNIKIPKRIP